MADGDPAGLGGGKARAALEGGYRASRRPPDEASRCPSGWSQGAEGLGGRVIGCSAEPGLVLRQWIFTQHPSRPRLPRGPRALVGFQLGRSRGSRTPAWPARPGVQVPQGRASLSFPSGSLPRSHPTPWAASPRHLPVGVACHSCFTSNHNCLGASLYGLNK